LRFTGRSDRPCWRHVDSPSPSDFSELQRPLEHFRAKTKRLKIHPKEMLLLWVVSLHLIFLPWAIGGMRLWGQLISLAFAVLTFALALVPRRYTEEHTGANSFRLIMWPKMRSFPIFWLGLALLAYVTVQGLNPAWIYVQNYNGWWMQGIEHVGWLPSGVSVPFERGGPWRMLLIYASAWLTVCAIWTGFTRRRSLQIFFITIAGNGLALAGLGLAQRILPNGKMFWLWESPSASFFSSFVYKNHAGSYLDLTLAVTCGLAAWYYLRGLRRLEKSSPAGLFAFFATSIGVTILVSYARGATLVMLVFLCVCVTVFVIHQLLVPNTNTTRKPIVAIMLMMIFGYFLKTGLDTLQSHEAWTRLSKGLSGQDASLESRRIATTAALDMLKENWAMGAGSGSFRFLFPAYQQHYPEIFAANGVRLYWEHAHNDLVEIAAELGAPGVALLLAAGFYLAARLVKDFFWGNCRP
jgi:O-antigen ligase